MLRSTTSQKIWIIYTLNTKTFLKTLYIWISISHPTKSCPRGPSWYRWPAIFHEYRKTHKKTKVQSFLLHPVDPSFLMELLKQKIKKLRTRNPRKLLPVLSTGPPYKAHGSDLTYKWQISANLSKCDRKLRWRKNKAQAIGAQA